MTINVAMATADAIVLGCDSLSSITQPVINLTKADFAGAVDADGRPIVDGTGQPVFRFPADSVEQQAVTVFGGVSKMFLLYQTKDMSVAAVTSGQGTIDGRTIAALAGIYRRQNEVKKTPFRKVEAVARDFLQFMGTHWVAQQNLKALPVEVIQKLPSVTFIVGGYAPDDEDGMLFKLDVGQSKIVPAFTAHQRFGLTWGGQAGYVERLMRGADGRLEHAVLRGFLSTLSAQRASVAEAVVAGLKDQGVAIPKGLKLEIKEVLPPTDPWDRYVPEIDFENLPVQYAIDLASLLVNTQSGMEHFASGIATVGGRTHIGVLQRNEPFKKLNEPKLAHTHTGYAHEF
ncbi:MAG TPA: hypothetical protein VGN46_14310 [Luteibacter sp.]|jgi:hypothetical protein|uniref:hypothetical protein n=1 Tax=Luteibacter sp. TaxID=1886636 RepID=UPI002F3EAA98